MDNNNQKFVLNDIVIAIKNPLSNNSQQRTKGKLYTVTDLRYCPTTGAQSININNTRTRNKLVKCTCGGLHSTNGKGWTASTYFRKVDETTIKELIDQEEYELAVVVRDAINGYSTTT